MKRPMKGGLLSPSLGIPVLGPGRHYSKGILSRWLVRLVDLSKGNSSESEHIEELCDAAKKSVSQ